MESTYFILFSNCIPVKGAKRSLICDLQRGKTFNVPNSLIDFFDLTRDFKIDEIFNNYSDNEIDIFNNYISFALDNDLGFFTDNPTMFPAISKDFETPYIIQDMIIEYSEFIQKYSNKILKEITTLGVQYIEFRIEFEFLDRTLYFIDKLINSRVQSVIIYVNCLNKLIDSSIFRDRIQSFSIEKIIFHGLDFNLKHNLFNGNKIIYTERHINNDSCGVIDSSFFNISLPFYLESINHNNCLNRKISIDKEGYLKSCLSINNIYGNIVDSSIQDALKNKHYKLLSSIDKSKINVCKDCEYRIVCSDCRAFIENPYDKPLKCNYNPYE